MKRNLTIIGVLISALLLCALLFTACSDELNTSANNGPLGTLIVQIGGEERTIAPGASGLTYKIILSGNTVNVNETITGSKTYSLASGYYSISAEAYSGTDIVAKFSDNVNIEAGQTTSKKLVLKPVYTADVPGTLSYDISYPDEKTAANNISYYSAEMMITPIDAPNDGPVYVNFIDYPEKKTGTLTLPPGIYIMAISIESTRFSGNTRLSVYRNEVVYVYPKMTTTATFPFTVTDFTADLYLAGTAKLINGNSDISSTIKEVNLYDIDDVNKVVKTVQVTAGKWELSIPSQLFKKSGSFSSVTLDFKTTDNTTYNKKTFYGVVGNGYNNNIELIYILKQPQPTTFTATANSSFSSVTLTWTAVSNDYVDGYNIYRSVNGGDYSKLNSYYTISGNNYTDSSLPAILRAGGNVNYQIEVVDYRDVSYTSTSKTSNQINVPSSSPLTQISSADTWASGNIVDAGGEQFFKFTATVDGYQYIHVNFGTLNDLYVQVYDSSGNTVGSQINLYSYTKYTSRNVTTGDEYYIRVWPYSSSDSGTYQITFNTSSVAPSL
jgi:hypothetical protein